MAVTHLEASASAQDIATVLGRDGCVIIDDLVDAATIDTLLDEMSPHIEENAKGNDPFVGFNTKRTGGLVARSAAARDLVMNQLVLDTTSEVLGHASNFQLHLTQIISIGPDSPAQSVHRDQWAFDFFPFPNGYEVQCNTLWAATDFTEENGATRVVVGSNHHDDGLKYQLSDTEPAEMTKGSVLLYTGAVYHGGGANQSQETRIGINITYNVAWLRQEENQYLSVPLDVAADLDDDLLKLIGYDRAAYALGYVDDLRHPLSVLRATTRPAGLGDLTSTNKRLQDLPTT